MKGNMFFGTTEIIKKSTINRKINIFCLNSFILLIVHKDTYELRIMLFRKIKVFFKLFQLL